jgi:hypothetical protein
MEIKRFGFRNEIVFSPTFSGSIAATSKKPMQHGEINGPLNIKVVAASCEQRLNYLLNTAFFPEPPKDQVRPDPLHRDSLSLAGAMRIDNGKLFAMTQARAYQRLEPSAGLEFQDLIVLKENAANCRRPVTLMASASRVFAMSTRLWQVGLENQ